MRTQNKTAWGVPSGGVEVVEIGGQARFGERCYLMSSLLSERTEKSSGQ